MIEGESKSPLRVQAAGDSEKGSREHNEDTVMLRPDLSLYLLADGAGGHNAGNIASALAVTTVAHYFEETADEAAILPEYDELGLSTSARRLATAIQHANRAIIDVAKTSQRYRGMGTTLVAVFPEPARSVVHVGHVGDSRCYRVRNGHIEQLTHDHTLINDVLALRPDMPDEQLARMPRNVITRALGMSKAVRVSVRSYELLAGDHLVLCSDGLSDEIDDAQIVEVLGLAKTPEEQVHLLLNLANEGGADDNIAVAILACDLAPGATSLPKRKSSRPRPIRRRTAPVHLETPAAEARPVYGDEEYPEIIIVGESITEDSSPSIHIVPAESASADILHAIHEFVDPMVPLPPKGDDD
jgi:protein phosphatase